MRELELAEYHTCILSLVFLSHKSLTKHGDSRGGSRKNFDILKIATPQAAPKDHTQKLQLCYERTIEGYYFLWHFN